MGNNILPIDNREGHENPNLHGYDVSSSDPESSGTFPTEIVAEILKYLSPTERKRCERVSELWRGASRKSWSDTKLLNFEHPSRSKWGQKHNDIEVPGYGELSFYIRDLTIRSLLSRPGPYKKFLRFKSLYHDITDGQIIPIVAHHCHNIQARNLEMVNTFYNGELNTIEYRSQDFAVEPLVPKNLKSMHLDACGLSDEDEERQKKILRLINQSKSLVRLSMRFLTTSYVMQGFCKCKKLQVLSLCLPFNPMLVFEVFMMEHSKRLKINFYMTCTLTPPLDLEFVQGLLKHCRSLERLEKGSRRDIIEGVNTIAYLSELMTLDLMVDNIEDFHYIRLSKIWSSVLREYGNDLPETGLITMILNFKQLQLFASNYPSIPSDVSEKFRDELGKCSRAIILMVPPKRVASLLAVCENSIIRIQGIDGPLVY